MPGFGIIQRVEFACHTLLDVLGLEPWLAVAYPARRRHSSQIPSQRARFRAEYAAGRYGIPLPAIFWTQ